MTKTEEGYLSSVIVANKISHALNEIRIFLLSMEAFPEVTHCTAWLWIILQMRGKRCLPAYHLEAAGLKYSKWQICTNALQTIPKWRDVIKTIAVRKMVLFMKIGEAEEFSALWRQGKVDHQMAFFPFLIGSNACGWELWLPRLSQHKGNPC